jgi:hypothetical protein
VSFWDNVTNAVASSPAVQATTQQSGDVGSLLAQYGITPGSAPPATNDPPVYLGPTPWKGAGWGGPHPHEQVVPLSQAQGSIYSWNEDQIKKFQDQIIDAGMVTKNQITYGGRDATTVAAWNQLVGQSADAFGAGVKMSPSSLLDELKGHPTPNGGKAPLTISLSNPDDIEAHLQDMFRTKLGQGNIDPSKIDAMVKAYQGQEASYQTQSYNQAQTGGTVVQPPSVDTFADTQAKQIDPTGYDAYKVLDKFSVLEKELTGR